MKKHRPNKLIVINTGMQNLQCFVLQTPAYFDGDPLGDGVNCQQSLVASYSISSAKNGLGEVSGSECTPRGWHVIYSVIGLDLPINSVLVKRQWTQEIYSEALARQWPERDWILTRILQLDGLEPGRNKGGEVDTLQRFIYIHGTPDSITLGQPGSHGCIRMKNSDIITLAHWVTLDTLVYIN